MDRNEREARRRQEDRALNKALIWVGVSIILEFLLVLVNRYYINFNSSVESINRAVAIQAALIGLRWVSLAAVVICVVWMLFQLSKNGKAVLPGVLSIAAAALLLCSHVILQFKDSGLRMLFWLVPAWAALALVYYLYQREFFYSAFYTGLGTMLLWMLRHKDSTVDPSSSRLTTYVFLAIVAILMVLGLVMLLQARKNGGVWSLAGREVRVLPAEAGYSLIFLTLAVNVVAVAAAAVMGGNVGYYLIYVLVAWLFALLVYYTVKMM